MKSTVEVSGISIEDLLSVMTTGLTDEADQVAWEEYCRAEHGAYAKQLSGGGGVKVSGKGEKGAVTLKGGSVKAKGVEITLPLYCLHLATAAIEVARSTNYPVMMVDVSPLCEAWKAKRYAKARKEPEPAPQS